MFKKLFKIHWLIFWLIVRAEYLSSNHDFICNASHLFSTIYKKHKRKIYTFASINFKTDLYSFDTLFSLQLNKSRRQIRIDFLNWAIKNYDRI